MIYKYHDLYLQRKYIITGMYIWKLLQQMHGDVWTWSCILFAPAPRLAWPKCHVKTEVELELLPDVDMQLTIEKGIRDRVWHAIGMQKPTTILCLQIQIQRLTQWKLNKFMEDKSNIVISAQIAKHPYKQLISARCSRSRMLYLQTRIRAIQWSVALTQKNENCAS